MYRRRNKIAVLLRHLRLINEREQEAAAAKQLEWAKLETLLRRQGIVDKVNELNAAIKIQSAVRMHFKRLRYYEFIRNLRRERAATRIQTAWRRNIAGKVVAAKRRIAYSEVSEGCC